jgi:hypothetical protein
MAETSRESRSNDNLSSGCLSADPRGVPLRPNRRCRARGAVYKPARVPIWHIGSVLMIRRSLVPFGGAQ